MVREAGFLVAFLAGVAVALGADFDGAVGGAVAARAVGVELLVADDLGVVVELEVRRAEVVKVLVAGDVGRGDDGCAGVDGLGFDEADAAVIVVDVEGLALEVEVVRRVDVLVLAVGLPAAEVEALLAGGAREIDVDLADALAGAVVDVVGLAAADGIAALQAIVVVSGEAPGDVGHGGHVAVSVVRVEDGVVRRVVDVVEGGAGGPELVATGMVGVTALPDNRHAGFMLHPQDVADRVVGVSLGVVRCAWVSCGCAMGAKPSGVGIVRVACSRPVAEVRR
ncbi:hypothetical protein [Nannocystis exedens]|uniref:hypothetical protein n=1 Tax=Nannocystis exedens TaxID=54 RepID=UPI00210D816E|nr:hypothetical protein [Nannocystis exedens]